MVILYLVIILKSIFFIIHLLIYFPNPCSCLRYILQYLVYTRTGRNNIMMLFATMLLLLKAVSPSLSRELVPVAWYVSRSTIVLSPAELSIVPGISPVVIPRFNALLAPDTFLTCVVTPSINSLITRWRLPNGVVINFGDGGDFIVSQGTQNTILLIQNITYKDAGNYTCEVRNMSDSMIPIVWYRATVELQLLGTCFLH